MSVPLLFRVASGRESNLDFVVLAVAFASWDFFCVLFFVSLVLIPDLGSSDEEHPIRGKCAGTAMILPWNSHIHYAGTAYASPAIPTSAIKRALEQP